MRVVLACGGELIQKRVKQMLSRGNDVEVVGQVLDREQVLPEIKRLDPDAVILISDGRATDKTAINIVHDITREHLPARTIILTENIARDLVPAIRAGASGLLAMCVDRDELLDALAAFPHKNIIRAKP